MLRLSGPGRWRRPSGRVRVLILVVSWLLVVLGALGLGGYLYRGGSPATILVSAIAPYLLLLGVPALVLSLVARHWVPAVVALAVSIVFVVVQAPVWVSSGAPRSGRDLVVMTSNLKIGGADPARVVDLVRHRDVDVLMLEELTPEALARLTEAGLDRVLPHRLAEPLGGAGGTGLWSRYPLTALDWPQLSFKRVVASVRIPGMVRQPILVALHVNGPVPSAINWNLDLKRLPAMLAALPATAPVVVGGDFNATRSVAQFRGLLTGGYADAADQAGAGLTRTYPADSWLPPVLGIDHVLTRGGAVARSVDTVTVAGSDHRALVVRVTLSDARSDTR